MSPITARDRHRQTWNLARWALGLVLAATFLALAFRGVDVGQLQSLLRQAKPGLLVGAFLVGSANLLVRAVRWRMLLSASRSVPLSLTFWILSLGYLGNAVLPMRAGDLGRSYLMGRRTGIGGSFALATTLAERVLDAGFLVVAGGLALGGHPALPTWLSKGLALLAAFSLIALLGMLAIPPVWTRLADRLETIPRLSAPFGRMRRRWLDRFFEGLASVRHPRRMLLFLALTLGIWIADACVAILVARSLSVDLSFPAAFVLLAALGIGSTLQFIPGQLGVFQWITASVIGSYGVARAAAVLIGLSLQAVSYLILLFWGLLATLKLGGFGVLRSLGRDVVSSPEPESPAEETAG